VLKEWASYFPAVSRLLGEPWVTPTLIIVGLGVVVWAALDRGSMVGFDNLRFLPERYRAKRVPHEYIVGTGIILCLFVFGLLMHKRVITRYQVQVGVDIPIKDRVATAAEEQQQQKKPPVKTHPPEVLLIYRDKKIEIHNPGPGTLYFWGGAYGDSKVPLDSSPPRVIVPGAYYYVFMDSVEDEFRAALTKKQAGAGTTTFHAFVTTENSRKYTVRGILLGKVVEGSLSVHTQVLPTIDGWNDAPQY
jgi:hypothetical protein